MGDPYLTYAGRASGYAGVTLAPGARIAAFVHHSGAAAYTNMDPLIEGRGLYTTLNAALGQARSGAGDVVFVLPGHAENVSTADHMVALVAGTRVVGGGHGNARPRFTWSAATATWLFDVANVTIENCVLEMSGFASGSALSVAAPITVSAAGCAIRGCRIRVSDDANELATIAITTTAAGDDFTIEDCLIHGDPAGEVTTMVQLVGADRFTMRCCVLVGATSSTTVGVMRLLTTASLQITVENCTFINQKASSVDAVTGIAAATGVVRDCDFGILDNATLVGWTAKGDLMFFRCQTVNLAGETGAATTVVST